MYLGPTFLDRRAEVHAQVERRSDLGQRDPGLRIGGVLFADVHPVAEDTTRGQDVVLAVRRSSKGAVLPFEDILVIPGKLHALVPRRGRLGTILVQRIDAERLAGVHDLGEAVVETDGFGEHLVDLAEGGGIRELDLMDKPIGWILLNESVANGRLFGHTLLFAGIIALVGFHVKEHRTAIFCVAFGVFMHLLEDLMWETPATLLYPLFGFGFPHGSIGDWHGYFLDMVIRIYTPAFSYAFVTEVIGITILIGFAGFALYTTLNVKENVSTKTNLKNSR